VPRPASQTDSVSRPRRPPDAPFNITPTRKNSSQPPAGCCQTALRRRSPPKIRRQPGVTPLFAPVSYSRPEYAVSAYGHPPFPLPAPGPAPGLPIDMGLAKPSSQSESPSCSVREAGIEGARHLSRFRVKAVEERNPQPLLVTRRLPMIPPAAPALRGPQTTTAPSLPCATRAMRVTSSRSTRVIGPHHSSTARPAPSELEAGKTSA